MDKQRLIEYLITSFNSGNPATRLGIIYTVTNKTFSMEIDGERYSLTANQLADLPDGVGDELANRIRVWAY